MVEAATLCLEGQFGNTGATLAADAVAGGGAGASAALAGDVYNRQLHREEAGVLEQIKKGRSPEEQQRLTDAACALTQCASGVPDGDPAKPALVASQQRGQAYTDEQSSLLATGMFGYSGWNSVADWSSRNQVGTRSVGALQWLGGNLQVAGAVAAASTCETGIGCAAAGYLYTTGVDNAIAGSQTTLSGMATPTLGGQTLHALGMSPWAAELVYGATKLSAGRFAFGAHGLGTSAGMGQHSWHTFQCSSIAIHNDGSSSWDDYPCRRGEFSGWSMGWWPKSDFD